MHLPVRMPALFTSEVTAESPMVEDGAGLRINAAGLEYDGEALALDLLVGHRFPSSYRRCFRFLAQAISCFVEDAGSARAAGFALIDPYRTYPGEGTANFRGAPEPPAGPELDSAGYMRVPLQIPASRPAWLSPSLFLTVALQGHVSNTLAIDLHAGTVATFLDGAPCPITREQDFLATVGEEGDAPGEEAPAPPPLPRAAPPRLTLAASPAGPHSLRSAVRLDGQLEIPAADLEAGGLEGWARSLFLSVTRQEGPSPRIVSWLGDRLVFGDDAGPAAAAGTGAPKLPFSMELAELLGGPLERGTYYVQASARQYRSGLLELVCE